jgi:SsrA-binding protein
MLTGTEVKSLREGRATITEAHAGDMGGEMYLFNAYIPEFHGGNRFNHEPRRPRSSCCAGARPTASRARSAATG